MIIRGVVRTVEPYESLTDFMDKVGLNDLRAGGESAAQFLLRFAISHPALHTTIIGTKSLDHLADNVKAVEAGPLATDVLAAVKARLAAAGITPAS